jgi:acetyl esterase
MKRLLASGALVALAAFPSTRAAQPQRCLGIQAQPMNLPGAQSYTYKTASGRSLRIHVFAPTESGTRPAILFFFGGGWSFGKVTQFLGQAKAAAAKGYVAVLADYRVSCRDGTTPLDSVSDARAAYAWLRQQSPRLRIDSHRIVLSGGSAGGQLAAVTALLAPVGETPAALVLFNPALDMVALGSAINLAPMQAASISPSALQIDNLPPTIIFHGVADTLVPIQTASAFCARATSAGRSCELHAYDDQNHGFFNSHVIDLRLNTSPYEDTLSKTLRFLDNLGISS